ncbi:MAG: glycosyltransferase family 4 protein [Deltaproteobacteria bacterium]|nr:glycosyltransferase family 4 protein [Deltaproteobacteria bacterium]
MNRPMKILTFYDVQGWAWWHRSHHIQENLSPAFQLDIKQDKEKYNPLDYDIVMIFDYYFLTLDHFTVPPPDRLLIGCSNSRLIDEMIYVVEQSHCLAGFMNNFGDYKKMTGHPNYFCCQNGVDTSLFYPPAQRPEKFKACWVGSLNSMCNKGGDLIKAACEKAGVELICVGVDPRYDKLLSHDQLREQAYHHASVLICASEFEGTPNPALEAMACGVPVISTRVGNMPELIREGYNGILVNRSVDEIADAIRVIAALDKETLAINCRQSIENGWTWKQQTKKYETMFTTLAARRGL